MVQIGRNLTDPFDGFLCGKRLLVMDRGTKCTASFRALLEKAGTVSIRLPYRPPNLNACAERFVRSAKAECPSKMIFFGEGSLRRAIRNHRAHYHAVRNHQGLGNRSIEPENDAGDVGGPVMCRERLGGMLRFFYRQAS